MGDNFLKQQADNSRRGRDRAVAELEKPTLFSRPEIINTTYPIRPAEGVVFEIGEVLNAFRQRFRSHRPGPIS